jgi:hypothetical protein
MQQSENIDKKQLLSFSPAFWVLILLIFFVLITGIVIYFRNRTDNRPGNYSRCVSNCQEIERALEMYSTDNNGFFPSKLDILEKEYLRHIPTCSSAKADTYSAGYQVCNNPKEKINRYTFYCEGFNHKDVGIKANYPQYNSTDGLIPR